MIRVHAQGPARAQAPARAHLARDRDGRRDGERHVRPHGHDQREPRRAAGRRLREGRRRRDRARPRSAVRRRAGVPRRDAWDDRAAARRRGRRRGGRRRWPRSSAPTGRWCRAGARCSSAGASTRALCASARSGSPAGAWPTGPGEVVIDAETAVVAAVPVGERVGIIVERRTRAARPRHRHRGLRQLELAGGRHGLDLRPPHRAAAVRSRGPARPDRRGRAAGRVDVRAALPDQVGAAAPHAGAHEPAAGAVGVQRLRLGDHDPALLPARVRRDRPLRGGVRDRQHALDHRRPADAGVRHAAHARRERAPGALRGDPRGARDRASSPRRSGWASGSALAKGARGAVQGRRAQAPAHGPRVRDAHDRGLARRRHRRDARREPDAGAARHARPADRGRYARGRCSAGSRLARLRPAVALVICAAAVALVCVGGFVSALPTGPRLLLLGVGVLGVFLGIAMVAPSITRPLARVLGWPAARIGGAAGRLARSNAMRNPARTASTAAALMIGLALVTAFAVLGQGLKQSTVGAVKDEFRGDYVLTSQNGFTPTSVASTDALRRAGVATVVAGERSGRRAASSAGRSASPGSSPGSRRLLSAQLEGGHGRASWQRLGAARRDRRLGLREAHHLTVGSPISLETPAGRTIRLRVAAVYNAAAGRKPARHRLDLVAHVRRALPQPAERVHADRDARAGSPPPTPRRSTACWPRFRTPSSRPSSSS